MSLPCFANLGPSQRLHLLSATMLLRRRRRCFGVTADLFAQSKGVEIRFLFLLSPSYSCRVNLSHPVKFISEG